MELIYKGVKVLRYNKGVNKVNYCTELSWTGLEPTHSRVLCTCMYIVTIATNVCMFIHSKRCVTTGSRETSPPLLAVRSAQRIAPPIALCRGFAAAGVE